MANVMVCYKWVLDETDLEINGDLSVNFGKAKGKISDYDRNGIEAGVRAAKELGGKAIGLTFGTADAKQSLKPALSRGLDEGCWVNAEEASAADGAVTANVLAGVVAKQENAGLVVCAEGASDTYARQVPSRIGARLDWPVITSVMKMEFSGGTLTAVRKLEDCLQTVKVSLPAVVSVLPEIYEAPIPGLKAVMSAGKKPVTEYHAADLNVDMMPKSVSLGYQGYVMNRKNVVYKDGDAADKVKALAAALRKEGVL